LPAEAVLCWTEEEVRLFFLTDGVVVPDTNASASRRRRSSGRVLYNS
jgi:sulfur relay (sulfurtransferase) complex TusBCD TusD component (DsrE family)